MPTRGVSFFIRAQSRCESRNLQGYVQLVLYIKVSAYFGFSGSKAGGRSLPGEVNYRLLGINHYHIGLKEKKLKTDLKSPPS